MNYKQIDISISRIWIVKNIYQFEIFLVMLDMSSAVDELREIIIVFMPSWFSVCSAFDVLCEIFTGQWINSHTAISSFDMLQKKLIQIYFFLKLFFCFRCINRIACYCYTVFILEKIFEWRVILVFFIHQIMGYT